MVRTLGTIDDDLALDANGNMQVVTELEGLRQKVQQKLRLWRGEWFLDTRAGVPYEQDILIRGVDPGLVTSLLNAQILAEPEVREIVEVSADLDRDTRVYTYTARVASIFGEMEISL